MSKYTDFIKSQLDERTLLEQLAEESAEMGKAALKLIRAREYSNNVTPVPIDDARANLSEEVWDVIGVLYLLGYDVSKAEVERYWKIERWAVRMGYKDGDNSGDSKAD